jgi:hypothetical protein
MASEEGAQPGFRVFRWVKMPDERKRAFALGAIAMVVKIPAVEYDERPLDPNRQPTGAGCRGPSLSSAIRRIWVLARSSSAAVSMGRSSK